MQRRPTTATTAVGYYCRDFKRAVCMTEFDLAGVKCQTSLRKTRQRLFMLTNPVVGTLCVHVGPDFLCQRGRGCTPKTELCQLFRYLSSPVRHFIFAINLCLFV